MAKENKEMTLAESAAWRASLYKPEAPKLSDEEKKEAFRQYWATERSKYNQPRDLEQVLWLHAIATKKTDPSQFDEMIQHFGFKKI